MSLNRACVHDVERCARLVYELHDDLAQRRARLSLDRIFDRDRRLVIGLTGQLVASIALIPWLGVGVVLAGLVVLYVGALASTAWTLSGMSRVRSSERRESIELAVRRAVATSPPLDATAIALVIRLANLAAIPPTATSVAMLQSTLREAKARPSLREWPFLADIAALVDGPNCKTLLMPPLVGRTAIA